MSWNNNNDYGLGEYITSCQHILPPFLTGTTCKYNCNCQAPSAIARHQVQVVPFLQLFLPVHNSTTTLWDAVTNCFFFKKSWMGGWSNLSLARYKRSLGFHEDGRVSLTHISPQCPSKHLSPSLLLAGDEKVRTAWDSGNGGGHCRQLVDGDSVQNKQIHILQILKYIHADSGDESLFRLCVEAKARFFSFKLFSIFSLKPVLSTLPCLYSCY